jgi:hypothetical protein
MTALPINLPDLRVISPPTMSAAEEEPMTEWTVEVDGQQVQVITADEAGKLFVTRRSPNGVSAIQYAEYARRGTAPGPQMVTNPLDPDGDPVAARHPVTGRVGYPRSEVERAAAARPGRGGWYLDLWSADTLNHTELREQMLIAARDGRLEMGEPPRADRIGPVLIDGQPLVVLDKQGKARRQTRIQQERGLLQRLGMLDGPGVGESGLIRITDAGRAALTRWSEKRPR